MRFFMNCSKITAVFFLILGSFLAQTVFALDGDCENGNGQQYYCQWETGCFGFNELYGSGTCLELISECIRYGEGLFVNVNGIDQSNGWGQGVNCAANGGVPDAPEVLSQPPVIITTSLSSGTVNESYSAYIEASSSITTWSITAGSLPPGINLNGYGSSYRYISGTPTTPGTYTFTVQAENAAGSTTKDFTIVIAAQTPPVITTNSLRNGMVNERYGVSINSTSGSTIWSITGSLPPGLEFDYGDDYSDYGDDYSESYIYGTPTTAGTYTFTVQAENAAGSIDRKSVV
jgi:hypothetical protein